MKKFILSKQKHIAVILSASVIIMAVLTMVLDIRHGIKNRDLFISREDITIAAAPITDASYDMSFTFPVTDSILRFDTANSTMADIDNDVKDSLDSIPQEDFDPSPPVISQAEQDAADLARYKRASLLRKKNRIPDYSRSDIHNMDLTAPSGITVRDLREIGGYSGLKGLEKAFVKAEKDHGINCLFMYSLAVIESAGGTKMYRPNNMFGFMGKSFRSKAECIDYVSGKISANYLRPGGSFYRGKRITDVNVKYSTSSTWDSKIEGVMFRLYRRARVNNLAKYD